MSPAQVDEVWARWRSGQAVRVLSREMRVTSSTVRALLLRAGGIGPVPRRRARLRLSLTEREEISRGLAAGWSLRATGVWHEFECTVTAVADAIDGSPMDSTVVKVGVSDDGTSYA